MTQTANVFDDERQYTNGDQSHSVASRQISKNPLGYRINEWTKLTSISRPTVWRQVKQGDLKVVYIGKIPIIPHTEAVRLGLVAK